jgi:hypothetical protein
MSADKKEEQSGEYWEAHSKSWRTSRLSQMEYCDQSGISYKSFIYQHNRILKRERRACGKFIEVKHPSTSVVPLSIADLQLMLPNGIRIGIGKEVNLELLETVLTVAGRLSC